MALKIDGDVGVQVETRALTVVDISCNAAGLNCGVGTRLRSDRIEHGVHFRDI